METTARAPYRWGKNFNKQDDLNGYSIETPSGEQVPDSGFKRAGG